MRKLVSAIVAAIVLMVTVMVQPVLADASPEVLTLGKKVFQSNCAACHINGGNIVMAPKNLKQAALKQYGMDSMEAIVTQVTNGKAAMPSFKNKLSTDEIGAVATYVLSQAEKDWKG